MGNVTSRKSGVSDAQKSPVKKSVAATIEQSPTVDKATIALDPKTPAIPQTPLTQTIANHLNRITKEEGQHNPNIKTPSYLMRKKILYDLGYTYPIGKEVDPRSPSQSIPRTPLNLTDTAEEVNVSESSSFQYNSSLEDSCREFNMKLNDITMDETEAQNEHNENVPTKNIDDNDDDYGDDVKKALVAKIETTENGAETQASLCAQKTPECDSVNTPNFEKQPNENVKVQSKSVEQSNETAPNAFDKSIDQNDSMVLTPVMNKSLRTGRIPLSVVNRRTGAEEVTPLQSKNNTSAVFSVEKNRKNLSFNTHDENRGSARKSKIPVFKK